MTANATLGILRWLGSRH